MALGSEILGRISLLAFQFLIANSLGASAYGTMGLALASAALISPLADLGLSNLVLREVANNPDPRVTKALVALKLGGTGMFLAVLLVCALVARGGPAGTVGYLFAGAFYATTSMADFLRTVFRARESAPRELLGRILYLGILLVVIGVVWWVRPGVGGALLAWSLPPLGLAAAYGLLLRQDGIRLKPDFDAMIGLARRRGRFLFQSILYLAVVALSTRLDFWILDARLDRDSVGCYFGATNFVMAGAFLSQTLSSHMYPALARAGSEGRARALGRAIVAHVVLGGIMCGGVVLVGKAIFLQVYRNPGYLPGADLLPAFGILLLLSTLDYLWLAILIGLDRQWIAAANLGVMILGKTLLGPILVDRLGMPGMVWAAVASELVVCFLGGVAACSAYLRNRRGNVLP